MPKITLIQEDIAFCAKNAAGQTETWATLDITKELTNPIDLEVMREMAADKANRALVMDTLEAGLSGARLNTVGDEIDKVARTPVSKIARTIIYKDGDAEKLTETDGRARVFYDSTVGAWRCFVNLVAVETLDDFNSLRDAILKEIRAREKKYDYLGHGYVNRMFDTGFTF